MAFQPYPALTSVTCRRVILFRRTWPSSLGGTGNE